MLLSETAVVLFALVLLGAIVLFAGPKVPPSSASRPGEVRPVRGIAAVGPEGQTIAVLTDRHCLAYDLIHRHVTPLWVQGSDERVTAIAGSPCDGNIVVCKEGSIQLQQVANGEIVWEIPSRDGVPRGAAYSRDGRLVAFGTEQGSIHILHTETGQESTRIETHCDVVGLCFSHDGSRIFAPEDGNGIAAWETETGRRVLRFRDIVENVSSIAVSLGGGQLAAVTGSGELHCWDLSNHEQHFAVSECGVPMLTVAFAPTSNRLYRGSMDGRLRMSVPGTPADQHRLIHRYGVRSLTFSRGMLVTAGLDGKVLVWDSAHRKSTDLIAMFSSQGL